MAAIPGSNAGAIIGSEAELDPRMHHTNTEEFLISQENFREYDAVVNQQPLEVYMYYAALEREKEARMEGEGTSVYGGLMRRLTGKSKASRAAASAPTLQHTDEEGVNGVNGEKHVGTNGSAGNLGEKKGDATHDGQITEIAIVSDEDRTNAYRALRTASWQASFFLIVTDILGPSSAPAALAALGYGGGVLVYTGFFVAAVAGGQIIWRLYCRLDSEKFPVRNYSDIGERIIGRWFRHLCNIIQSFQLFLNVSIILLGNGQTLATIINYKFCFVIINILFAILGAGVGQIKSLKNFAWLANLNIWLNIVTILMAIVGCSVYAPVPTLNFPDLVPPYPAVVHTGFAPDGTDWYDQVTGVIYAVFAYGGAMIFVDFMAEMKKPMTFWKAALASQSFIYIVYLLYGVIIYYYQGQYSYIIPTLSILNPGFQIAANVFAIVTAQIAAVLYGNIGVKIFYYKVLQPYFRAPDLNSRRGRFYWTIIVCAYWTFGFIVGSAIPNISALITLVGALCILHFTYTFPPLLWCAYLCMLDAAKGEEQWQPGMPYFSNRIDTWRQMSRWKRGFAGKLLFFKIFLILCFLGALALCGVGSYAGVEQIISAFQSAGSPPSFSCRTPGQPDDVPTPP